MFLKNVIWDICRKMHVGIAKTSETIVGKIQDSNVQLKRKRCFKGSLLKIVFSKVNFVTCLFLTTLVHKRYQVDKASYVLY